MTRREKSRSKMIPIRREESRGTKDKQDEVDRKTRYTFKKRMSKEAVELVEVRGSVCPFWSDCDIHRLARDETNVRRATIIDHAPILFFYPGALFRRTEERTEYPNSEFDVQGEEQERHSADVLGSD